MSSPTMSSTHPSLTANGYDQAISLVESKKAVRPPSLYTNPVDLDGLSWPCTAPEIKVELTFSGRNEGPTRGIRNREVGAPEEAIECCQRNIGVYRRRPRSRGFERNT